MRRFCSDSCRFESSTTTLPQISLQRYIGLDDAGLVLGAGTALVRRDPATHRLDLNADKDRCLALLSVALRQPVLPAILEHIQTAAEHWQGGDKALANLRLVFAGLRKLDGPADAYRLQAAGYLLDQGVAPQDLMDELGLDASGLGLDKYAPDQPRVPAGSGRESGRWSDGTTGAQIDRDVRPEVAVPVPQSPHRIEVAANGPFTPGGINVLPVPPGDTLDPRGLNKPLGFAEQQAIADTFNSIMTGQPYII